MTCAILQPGVPDWTHYSFTTAQSSFCSYEALLLLLLLLLLLPLLLLLLLSLVLRLMLLLLLPLPLLLLLLLLLLPLLLLLLRCWFKRPLMSRKFCGCCSKDKLQQDDFTGNGCFGDFLNSNHKTFVTLVVV